MSTLRVIQQRNPLNVDYDKPDLRGIVDENLKNSFPIPTLHIINAHLSINHLKVIENFKFNVVHVNNGHLIVKPTIQHDRFKEYCMVLFLIGHSFCENHEARFFLYLHHQLHEQIVMDGPANSNVNTANLDTNKWISENKNFISVSAQELVRQSGIALHVTNDGFYTNQDIGVVRIQVESNHGANHIKKAG